MNIIENEIRRIVEDELLKRYHVAPQAPAEASGDPGWSSVPPFSDADAKFMADAEKPKVVTPSPADPFAPMVEAAMKEWFKPSYVVGLQEGLTERMRRALAAAIENAPLTNAMIGAWADSRSSGVNSAWRVFNRALAAELRAKS